MTVSSSFPVMAAMRGFIIVGCVSSAGGVPVYACQLRAATIFAIQGFMGQPISLDNRPIWLDRDCSDLDATAPHCRKIDEAGTRSIAAGVRSNQVRVDEFALGRGTRFAIPS